MTFNAKPFQGAFIWLRLQLCVKSILVLSNEENKIVDIFVKNIEIYVKIFNILRYYDVENEKKWK